VIARKTIRRLFPLVAIVIATSVVPAWATQAPLPVGSITVQPSAGVTLPGYTVKEFRVACPSVQQAAGGYLAISTRAVSRGVILFFSGGPGTSWYAKGPTSEAGLADLANRGYQVVQVSWKAAWWQASPGEDAGPAHLACRPATVLRWAYDHLYAPLGLSHGLGRCGFCATGNSGGASQVTYALSAYGLAPILDAIVPTSGPPHASQLLGCERNPGEDAYWYDASSSGTIDASYGFLGGGGPCAGHAKIFESRWRAESVDTGASSLSYPSTRVRFIFGELDHSNAVALGQRFLAAIRQAGSPMVSSQTVPDTSHDVFSTTQGMQAIENALTR
jgi:hypothetical protein